MDEIRGWLKRGKHRKGACFALATALISGFSIYINKFAVMQMKDPFVFTTTKNLTVAALLFAFLILPRALPELKRLSPKQWLMLGAIGCIGGSVPFLLFFHGLSQISAANAAFIHKTLFVWVAILAVPFLGERLGWLQIWALGALVGGNLLLLGGPKSWQFGAGELMVFIATLLWAIEAVVARRTMLGGISPTVGAFGRMLFGAVVMLTYLAASGRMGASASLNLTQLWAIAYSAVFLFGYVSCYYAGLKHAPASIVASILVLGSVITSLLYAIFDARRYSPEQVAGMLLITAAALGLWYIASRAKASMKALPLAPVER